MKHIYYEVKKILNIKFLAIYVLIIVIGILSFYISLDKCMDETSINNILNMIELYGDDKTFAMEDKLINDYGKAKEILGLEKINLEKLLSGEMSHEEYSEYSRLVAKIKSYEKAWEYVMDKHYLVQDNNGYIIITEYWKCYFEKSLLHFGNVLLFLLITGMFIVSDKRRGVESVIAATYIGQKKVRIRKGITAAIFNFGSVVLFQILMIFTMLVTDRIDYINAPMNSLGMYQGNIGISIGCFLCIHILAMSLVFASLSGIIVSLFSKFREVDKM